MSENLFLHLMKNPHKSKKNNNVIKQDNLYIELNKNFGNINKDIYKLLLKKIEIFINESIIEDLLYSIINCIIDESNY
tara:strand:+ start:674 stop:907 length:234 start_codon:yes stop_codon:yes gene_type:complete